MAELTPFGKAALQEWRQISSPTLALISTRSPMSLVGLSSAREVRTRIELVGRGPEDRVNAMIESAGDLADELNDAWVNTPEHRFRTLLGYGCQCDSWALRTDPCCSWIATLLRLHGYDYSVLPSPRVSEMYDRSLTERALGMEYLSDDAPARLRIAEELHTTLVPQLAELTSLPGAVRDAAFRAFLTPWRKALWEQGT